MTIQRFIYGYMYTIRVPGFVADLDETVDVLERGDGELGEVLDVRAQQRVLAHAQVVAVLGVQQVTHPLTVDLHVADLQVRPRDTM